MTKLASYMYVFQFFQRACISCCPSNVELLKLVIINSVPYYYISHVPQIKNRCKPPNKRTIISLTQHIFKNTKDARKVKRLDFDHRYTQKRLLRD